MMTEVKQLKKSLAYLLIGMLLSLSAFAQERQKVVGTVTAEGEPLIGVAVYEKDVPSNGTITDMDGNYALTLKGANAVLVFQYVGYGKQEISVNGLSRINVSLSQDSEMLDEVVVVGYGTQKKVNVTGSVGVADMKELEERPVANIDQALQGVVPGLNLTVNNNGGRLDNAMSIDVRGLGTIGTGSSSSPLILIDGVEGNLSTLNPNDIESISVLKDVASASIYGARAAFGVILVKTKSGKAGKTSVSVSTNVRFNGVVNLPKSMDSYQFAQYFNRASTNAGGAELYSQETMQRILDYQKGILKDGTYADPSVENQWMYTSDYLMNANTDWFATLYKEWSPSYETSVNITGGNDKVKYFFSGSFLDQNGHLEFGKDNRKRYNVNANIDMNLAKWLSVNYSTKWTRTDHTQPNYFAQDDLWLYNIMLKRPTKPVYDPNGYPMQGSDVQELTEGGRAIWQKDWLYQSLKLRITPLEGWTINLEGNYTTFVSLGHTEILPVYRHGIDGTLYEFINGASASGLSQISESMEKQNNMTLNAYTNYEKQLKSGHYFNVMLGVNADLYKIRTLSGTMTDVLTPSTPTLNTATSDPKTSGGYTHWANAGYFGRLNYNYKEKYLFEANLRYDGSSRFIGDERWALFPSFSAGWNMARETFLEDAEFVDNLKFRASWGELGNMNTTSYYPFFQALPMTVKGGTWLIDGEETNIASVPGIVSSKTTWERVRSWNIGLDWGLFNNRLTGSFDYFIRKTTDMIGPAPELPATLGTGVPSINNTDMKSQGFELEIGWRDRIKDFSYGVKFLLSDAKQTITRYPNETKSLSLAYYEGKVYGEIWGYETVGIAKSDEEMNAHLQKVDQSYLGSSWAAGDIMYADLDGDGKIGIGENTVDKPGDRKVIGNSTPRYNYAISLDGEWKGIDVRIFLQGVGKKDFAPGAGDVYFWGATGGYYGSTGFVDHWDFFRPEGDPLGANLDAYYPRPIFDTYKNQQIQSKYVQSAAYLRLKNLQIGYTLPKSLTQKWGVQMLRFYISGENLLTFTKLADMFDPETISGNWMNGAVYPLNKTISIGLNLNF